MRGWSLATARLGTMVNGSRSETQSTLYSGPVYCGATLRGADHDAECRATILACGAARLLSLFRFPATSGVLRGTQRRHDAELQ